MECGLTEINYYQGYQLDDILVFELTGRQIKLLDACIFLINNNATIRSASQNIGIAPSTLHRLIHTELKGLSYELYRCTVRVLKNHKYRV